MKFFMYTLLAFLVLSEGACCCAEEKWQDLFEKGNEAYINGAYAQAARYYGKVLDKGIQKGHVHYNLGNAYLKMGQLGEAMISYRRASRFMPNDSALLANFTSASSLKKQQFSSPGRTDPLLWPGGILSRVPIGWLFVLAGFFFYGLFWVLMEIFVVRGRRKTLYIVPFLVLVLFVGSTSILKRGVSALRKQAVVTAHVTDARFEPRSEARTHFPLYEGAMVFVERITPGWYRIGAPDGRLGWVAEKDISFVFPGKVPQGKFL